MRPIYVIRYDHPDGPAVEVCTNKREAIRRGRWLDRYGLDLGNVYVEQLEPIRVCSIEASSPKRVWTA